MSKEISSQEFKIQYYKDLTFLIRSLKNYETLVKLIPAFHRRSPVSSSRISTSKHNVTEANKNIGNQNPFTNAISISTYLIVVAYSNYHLLKLKLADIKRVISIGKNSKHTFGSNIKFVFH